jgi:ATP-binding cassette subfamily C (CFTR/MRP) protein 1
MQPKPSPSLLSKLLFSWATPVIRRANKAPLNPSDLPELPKHMEVTGDCERLGLAAAKFKPFGYLSIFAAAASCYIGTIAIVMSLSFVCLAVALANPLILRELLKALSDRSYSPEWIERDPFAAMHLALNIPYPTLCALALATSSIVGIFGSHYLFFFQPNMAIRLRSALNALIFKKALRQQRSEQHRMSTGLIVNLVATDSLRIQNLFVFLNSIWYHPLTLIAIIFLLYRLVGAPALVGGCTLALLLSCSIFIAREQGRLRSKLSRIADNRVGLTRETLLHIKAAKSQGWEANLENKINSLRKDEAAISAKLARLSALFAISSGIAPAAAMATTSILLVRSGATLEAATLFPILTLFMQLRFSLNMLPETVHSVVEASVAAKRIYTFLTSAEFAPTKVVEEQAEAIRIQELQTKWSSGGAKATRVRDSILISRGELVVVVGSVGSGKTALLLSILGELPSDSGSVSLEGTVSYVPQQPWIISDSVRDNITFGRDFDNSRYHRALFASGLRPDLQNLPAGDATRIGERGINLSGGQRHRVALARAVYQNAEIYLLDDPLSALDPQVARHVFNNLIRGELQEKTRIVVSHRLEFAMEADRVIVVENGEIIEQGEPRHLIACSERFKQLLHFHRKISDEGPLTTNDPRSANFQIPQEEEEADGEEDLAESPEPLIQTEERRSGSVSNATVSSYFKKLAPGFALVGIALLFLCRQGAALTTDLWLTSWSGVKQIDLTTFLSGYLGCVILLGVIGYLRTMQVFSAGINAGISAHKDLLHGVLHAPLSFFESHPVGRVLNRFSRDLENVELALPRALIDAGHCLIETLTVCIIVTFVAPAVFMIIAPAAAIYYLAARFFRPASRDLQRLSALSLSPIFAILSECLVGVEALRASKLADIFTTRYTNALDAHNRITYMQTATNRWLGLRLESLGVAIILGIGLSVSLNLGISSSVALSGLALAYAIMMTSTMVWAIRSMSMVENNLTSYERIERYAQTPSESPYGSAAPAGWPSRGAITIRELCARYKPELPLALDRLSCAIPAGNRVGIIGRTGSGKSTLISSFLRIIEPSSGSIEIDGVDLSTLALSELRGALSVVPQEPILFSGQLRESLDPFKTCSDQEIWHSLERVGLKEIVESLPNKINADVREGGINFSAGQRQLISLARALLRKSKVIILDEATASIDSESDYQIQNVLRNELRGATVLIVAHRLPTVMDADLILGLKNGRLIDFGSPSELLSDKDTLLSSFRSYLTNSVNYT